VQSSTKGTGTEISTGNLHWCEHTIIHENPQLIHDRSLTGLSHFKPYNNFANYHQDNVRFSKGKASLRSFFPENRENANGPSLVRMTPGNFPTTGKRAEQSMASPRPPAQQKPDQPRGANPPRR
jgi:hypothetical protein